MDSQQARLNNDKDTEAELQQTLEGARLVRQRQAAGGSKIFMAESCKSRKAEKAKDERRKGYVCYMMLQQGTQSRKWRALSLSHASSNATRYYLLASKMPLDMVGHNIV